jgi:uracil phosphoribosyltransferase
MVWDVGNLYRGHMTLQPVEYLRRLPEPEGRLLIIADPVAATGNSACHAVGVLVRHGGRRRTSFSSRLSWHPRGLRGSRGIIRAFRSTRPRSTRI